MQKKAIKVDLGKIQELDQLFNKVVESELGKPLIEIEDYNSLGRKIVNDLKQVEQKFSQIKKLMDEIEKSEKELGSPFSSVTAKRNALKQIESEVSSYIKKLEGNKVII
jgi:predicted  nucleic acid-binding Zn-ribbon protein